MIQAIDHINIVVSDLDRSLQFYTQILGFKEIRRAELGGTWIEEIVGLKNAKAKVVYIIAPGGEPRLELLCYEFPPGKGCKENALANTYGLRHIALKTNDIDSAVIKLKKAGYTTISPPIKVPVGVVKHDEGQKTLCYFHDPDGVILELTQYK